MALFSETEIMTEEELRAIYGFHFRSASYEDLSLRFACQTLLHKINQSAPEDASSRHEAFRQLFRHVGKNVQIVTPFFCDFGKNIEIGDDTFLNFNCTILDCAQVKIGKRVWIAPNVQICAVSHPIDPIARRSQINLKPVTIGDDVWLGGGVIVCHGVTIGDRTVIGAGSIVTHNIPSDVVAYGNPCRVERKLRSDEHPTGR
jgi:maltose O-acetyltransferase